MSQITKRCGSRASISFLCYLFSRLVIVWLIQARDVHCSASIRKTILKGKELFNSCKEKQLYHQKNNGNFIVHFLQIFPASVIFLIKLKKEIIHVDFEFKLKLLVCWRHLYPHKVQSRDAFNRQITSHKENLH